MAALVEFFGRLVAFQPFHASNSPLLP
jgi:hypothetical protein